MTSKSFEQVGLRKLRSSEVEGRARVSYDTPYGRVTRCVRFGRKDSLRDMRQRLDEMRAQLEQRREVE